MIEKEHKTIEEQIQILKKRGLIIRNEEEENSLKTYLLEYGYERVITGSNSLFKTSNEDNYDENSKAEHLMIAFDIDRNISIEIFKYLSKSAEIKINTIIANTIAGILSEKKLQKNGLIFGINDNDYQIIFPNYEEVLNNKKENQANKVESPIFKLKRIISGESVQNGLYNSDIKEIKNDFESTKKDIEDKDKVKRNIEKNINEFQAKLKYPSLYLPIWKIANTWNLASTITIFKSMNKEKQNEIIENICPKFKHLKINPEEFTQILYWIKNFRNMLAHNYSVYKMNYVLKETRYDRYEFNGFIEKLKNAKIIPSDTNFNRKVWTGLIRFVKLLEVFLSTKENKIKEGIEEIIEKKFDKKIKAEKDDVEQLEKVKEKIKDIIYK